MINLYHEKLTFPMAENRYTQQMNNTMRVSEETVHEGPIPAKELHEYQSIELQQTTSVNGIAREEERAVYDGSLRHSDSQESPYMELQQQENIYETVRTTEYEVRSNVHT